MKELIKAVKRLAKTLPANDSYPWRMPDDLPIRIPANIASPRLRHIYLKENLAKRLKSDSDLSLHYWLIQKWGGISGFKKSEKNDKRIRGLFVHLPKGKLQKNLFDVISSLSKVAAYRYPAEYSIYDSRAVMVLNWLLFRHTKERFLFPIPQGRGATVTEFDTGTMYRLSGLTHKYRSWEDSYHDYCVLMNRLSVQALGEQRPYHMEMLLFVAAAKWIRGEFKQYASLKIRTDFS